MGNQIVAQFAEALRLSTAGTTLCSNSVSYPPGFVDIRQFPGVARAWVNFNGGSRPVNTNVPIYRSYNVESVEYKGPGRYKIIFSPGTFTQRYNVYTTGTLLVSTVDAANVFFSTLEYQTGGGNTRVPTTTAAGIQTANFSVTNTFSIPVTSIFKDCDGASLIFFGV